MENEEHVIYPESIQEGLVVIKKGMTALSGKWSFIVLSELRSGVKRFNELRKILGISSKALADTLKNFELHGLVVRTVFPTKPVCVEYSLTEKGIDLDQVIIAMYNWSRKWLD